MNPHFSLKYKNEYYTLHRLFFYIVTTFEQLYKKNIKAADREDIKLCARFLDHIDKE